jgi:hypothetical protein
MKTSILLIYFSILSIICTAQFADFTKRNIEIPLFDELEAMHLTDSTLIGMGFYKFNESINQYQIDDSLKSELTYLPNGGFRLRHYQIKYNYPNTNRYNVLEGQFGDSVAVAAAMDDAITAVQAAAAIIDSANGFDASTIAIDSAYKLMQDTAASYLSEKVAESILDNNQFTDNEANTSIEMINSGEAITAFDLVKSNEISLDTAIIDIIYSNKNLIQQVSFNTKLNSRKKSIEELDMNIVFDYDELNRRKSITYNFKKAVMYLGKYMQLLFLYNDASNNVAETQLISGNQEDKKGNDQFKIELKTNYIYDANNRIIELTSYIKNAENNEWLGHLKKNIQYWKNTNKELLVTFSKFKKESNTFKTNSIIQSEFDANDNCILHTLKSGKSIDVETKNKYDETNKLIASTTNFYSPMDGYLPFQNDNTENNHQILSTNVTTNIIYNESKKIIYCEGQLLERDFYSDQNGQSTKPNHNYFHYKTTGKTIEKPASQLALSVVPASTNSYINIEMHQADKDDAKIFITDAQGRMIANLGTIKEAIYKDRFDVSRFATGTYFCNAVNKIGEKKSVRFVVE